MRVFLILFLFLNMLLANEFAKKIIIKEPIEDDFILIDLSQDNPINLDKQKALFSSEQERKLNNERLKYEDTNKDLALFLTYKDEFHFKFKSLDINASAFSEDAFKSVVLRLEEGADYELLNKQTNILYQTKSNFCTLFKCEEFVLFDSSNLLFYETMPQRMYEKKADFLLALGLLEFKENAKDETLQAFVAYKFINLKTNKILENKNLQITFYPTKQDAQQNYEHVLQDFSGVILDFLSKSVKENLNTTRFK